jgi:polyferredoxin
MNEEWSFEDKSKRPLKVSAFLVLLFILGFALWAYFYPVTSSSALFWVGAILMGFPIFIAAEGLGSLGLNAKWLKNRSGFLRISFAIFWVLICMAIFGLVVGLLSSLVVAES